MFPAHCVTVSVIGQSLYFKLFPLPIPFRCEIFMWVWVYKVNRICTNMYIYVVGVQIKLLPIINHKEIYFKTILLRRDFYHLSKAKSNSNTNKMAVLAYFTEIFTRQNFQAWPELEKNIPWPDLAHNLKWKLKESPN